MFSYIGNNLDEDTNELLREGLSTGFLRGELLIFLNLLSTIVDYGVFLDDYKDGKMLGKFCFIKFKFAFCL